MLPFSNVIEYPYGVTQEPPKGSPVVVPSIVLERFTGKKEIKKGPK